MAASDHLSDQQFGFHVSRAPRERILREGLRVSNPASGMELGPDDPVHPIHGQYDVGHPPGVYFTEGDKAYDVHADVWKFPLQGLETDYSPESSHSFVTHDVPPNKLTLMHSNANADIHEGKAEDCRECNG